MSHDFNKRAGSIFGWFLLSTAGLAVIIGLLCVIFRPDWLLQYDTRLVKPSEEFDPLAAINEYRKTAIQLLGGIVIAIGLYLTWRRIRAMEKTVFVAEEGQITDRFSKAIEQLGNDRLEVRLGGIFALERIARDSKHDHWTTMEILSAFIRNYNLENSESIKIEKERGEEKRKLKTPTDIQAAFTIIGRRVVGQDIVGAVLDLSEAKLGGAVLTNANLENVNLNKVYLKEAILIRTNLEEAYLYEAQLEKAILLNSCLEDAFLSEANLHEANLSGVNMKGANLYGACLKGANLRGANLENANLHLANLKSANLYRANLDTANLNRIKLNGANLYGAFLSGANLQGAYLEEANLKGAQLKGTDLRGAHLEGAMYLSMAQLKSALNAHLAHYDKKQMNQFAKFFEEE